VSRSYIGATNVLATTFQTDQGEGRLIDFMPAERRRATGRGEDLERSHRIMRLVEGVAGDIEFAIGFRPTFDYAREATTVTVSHGRAIAHGSDLNLELSGPIEFHAADSGEVTGRFRVSPGDRVWLVLADQVEADLGDPDSTLERTLAYWKEWASTCTYRGPYEDVVRRSALTLKLLTFEPSGALVAAPTTSLPEEIAGVRNWDYRYTWLRDSALILYALQSIGYHAEAMDFWGWLESLGLACDDTIQAMYTLNGSRHLPEQILGHLEGYRGSSPVRIGNAAAMQSQVDVYGEVLDAAHLCYESMRSPHPQLWSVLGLMADQAAARWVEPDQGIWETRSGARHYVHSKLLCWVALDRAVRLAHDAGMPGDVVLWQRTRDDIRDAILTRGYDRTLQTFTQEFDAPALDASALVIPLVGFLPPTDSRVRSTVRRLQERLTSNGLVYRYLNDDGLPGGEATFALCTFWLIDNLALAGQVSEARELFERVIGYANDLGLLAEEINPVTRELLGNYPQGYTHLALIRSALNIAKAETRGPEQHAVTPAERARRLRSSERDPVNRSSPHANS
jgi:GH15 family glucan-1,4-alpha-glucosidase